MISGCHPIRAKKARYYEDQQLQARILPPPKPTAQRGATAPPDLSRSSKLDDWADAVVVAPSSSNADDPANAGIRREPALPEHEEIVSDPRKPVQEFEPTEDEPDDDAQRLRVLQRQVRAVARQITLDPADDMGM